MNKFTTELPDHFILFSQTPKAQEQSRRILIRFAAFLAFPLLAVIFFGATLVSGFILILIVVILFIGLKQLKDWQHIPFAVNPSHPMMELDSQKKAEVMIRLHDGRWVEAGENRYRLIADDLLSGFNLVALDDEYSVLGYFTDEKAIGSKLRRTMALLNQSLALRDAHNEVEDEIEHARQRESLDSGLLDRDWPEDIELEDAVGPIAKILKGQE